ncbi:MAG TPA: zinc ribbon domain-containing protein [Planctomycetota bacterium]|nr:zinc ribbon domain-containing protein [Planctomycetota bacterium]
MENNGICPKCQSEVDRSCRQCPKCNGLLFFDQVSVEERLKKIEKLGFTQLFIHEQEYLLEKIYQHDYVVRIFGTIPFFLLFYAIYGFIWGYHNGWNSACMMALKLIGILSATLLVSLPLLFTINIIVGTSLSFMQIFLTLLLVNYLIGISLLSVSPIMALFLVYPDSKGFLQILNIALFAICSMIGLMFLWRAMDYFQIRSGASSGSWVIKVWSGLYIFIMIQLAWTANFFGDLTEISLFKQLELEGNFYMVLYQIAEKLMGE